VQPWQCGERSAERARAVRRQPRDPPM
jgi:hypothetical protein